MEITCNINNNLAPSQKQTTKNKRCAFDRCNPELIQKTRARNRKAVQRFKRCNVFIQHKTVLFCFHKFTFLVNNFIYGFLMSHFSTSQILNQGQAYYGLPRVSVRPAKTSSK